MSKKDTQIEEYLFDQNAVINRFLSAVGAANDTEYARIRGLPRSTIGTWRTRHSIPYSECEYLFCNRNISMDWLLTGSGEMYRAGRPDQVQPNIGNYGKESNVVTTGVNNGHIVAEAGRENYAGPAVGGRELRLCQWIQYYMQTHSEDEQAWLEVEMARRFPEFAEFAEWKKGQGT